MDSFTGIAVFTCSSQRSVSFLVHGRGNLPVWDSHPKFQKLPHLAMSWEIWMGVLFFRAMLKEKKERRKRCMFSQSRKSWSIVLGGTSLPGCQLLLFLVRLIQRCLAWFVSRCLMGPFELWDTYPRFKFLEFDCHLGSQKNLQNMAQSLPRDLRETLFLVVPNQQGGRQLETLVWWVICLRQLEEFRT